MNLQRPNFSVPLSYDVIRCIRMRYLYGKMISRKNPRYLPFVSDDFGDVTVDINRVIDAGLVLFVRVQIHAQ